MSNANSDIIFIRVYINKQYDLTQNFDFTEDICKVVEFDKTCEDIDDLREEIPMLFRKNKTFKPLFKNKNDCKWKIYSYNTQNTEIEIEDDDDLQTEIENFLPSDTDADGHDDNGNSNKYLNVRVVFLSSHKLPADTHSYLVIPRQLSSVHASNAFEWRNTWRNISSSSSSSLLSSSEQLKCSSLRSYLQSSESETVQKDFYDFNSKRDIEIESNKDDNNNNNNYDIMNPWNFIRNERKFEGNMVKQQRFYSRWRKPSKYISSFPALIAEIKQSGFTQHDELKKCMNLYEISDSNDILNRKMTEKLNINKKWNVVGLIDPDKNLSTLDHSLDSALYDYQIMNYHHWIPSVFKVNHDLTQCRLLSEIGNLNPYKYKNTLYPLIEQLFLYQIPQFQSITNMHLTNIPLRVVVKAQHYQLFNCNVEDSYLGNMHKEGLYEDIIGVGLYYYHIDEDVNGGELELASIIKVEDDWDVSGRTTLKDIKIKVKEEISLVFSNDSCYHRVDKLYGNGSRKIIAFFLLRPNISTNIPIDARFVVINWKYHSQHLILKWIKQDNEIKNGYDWMLDVIFEYVVGDKKYIENATELYNKCRRGYVEEITYNESDITSNGVRQMMGMLD